VAQVLAQLASGEDSQITQKILSKLSKKEQREISRAATAADGSSRIEAASFVEWTGKVVKFCYRAAMLITGEIITPFRLRAVENGVPAGEVSGMGLLPVFPELGYLTDYALSDEFHELRRAAGKAGHRGGHQHHVG
jgi:hypothetical protein